VGIVKWDRWSDVKCSDLCEVVLFWSEGKWNELRWIIGINVPCTLGEFILRVLDCIVPISFGVYLVLCLFYVGNSISKLQIQVAT
jgi:hypothetical protein